MQPARPSHEFDIRRGTIHDGEGIAPQGGGHVAVGIARCGPAARRRWAGATRACGAVRGRAGRLLRKRARASMNWNPAGVRDRRPRCARGWCGWCARPRARCARGANAHPWARAAREVDRPRTRSASRPRRGAGSGGGRDRSAAAGRSAGEGACDRAGVLPSGRRFRRGDGRLIRCDTRANRAGRRRNDHGSRQRGERLKPG